MRKMKDSGIEWIGEIPEDWNIDRIGSHFSEIKEKNTNNLYQNALQFKMGNIISKPKKWEIDEISDIYSAYTIVHKGDIMINGLNLEFDFITQRVAMVREKGIITSAYIALKPNHTVHSEYICYLFKSYDYMKAFHNMGKGLRKILNYSELKVKPIILPSLFEQQKISAFLDRKCTEIDSVISKTKATIEEYKKLKQSVITQAVTKGIIPNRPMKDSGIEWIGEIPQEWKLIPFRYVLKERNEKNSPIKSYERLSLSIDLGVTTYSEKTTNLDRFKEDFEQYKLAHIGDLVMNSMNMIVGATGVSDYYGCVSPVYYTFYDETENHITAKFCEYIFRSKAMLRVLYSLGKGIYAIVRGDDRVNTCRLKVAKEDLKSLKIPLPMVQEQQEIVNYLDEKCSAIDTLIEKKQQLLTEMENYKKAVIYEYVTGKKEV